MSKWIEVVKAGKKTDYSGTCPKCGKWISNGSLCPLNLPAGPNPLGQSCPMKVKGA